MIAGNTAQSVGLERRINLAKQGSPTTFRLFRSDRVFSFTVNERGYEWGTSKISEDEIRWISAIPDDHELILDSGGDRVLEDDEIVNLSDRGAERFRSRPVENRSIKIIVNTREKTVSMRRLSFTKLVQLAFENPPTGENICFTVSYRKGPKKRPEGSLLEGEDVRIKEGMIFNVSATDKS